MGVSSSPSWHLTASLLRLRILRLVDLYHLATLAKWVLSRLAMIQGLAGNDAVDFYTRAPSTAIHLATKKNGGTNL